MNDWCGHSLDECKWVINVLAVSPSPSRYNSAPEMGIRYRGVMHCMKDIVVKEVQCGEGVLVLRVMVGIIRMSKMVLCVLSVRVSAKARVETRVAALICVLF